MFGANGSATIDSGLLQLRALDWNVDGQCDNSIKNTSTYIHHGYLHSQ